MMNFNAKILLFGEYAIIKGGQGLAITLPRFSGTLKVGAQRDIRMESLIDFISQSAILEKELDIERLKLDLKQGLVFESNIPQGYGVGSSGALCASVYANYSRTFKRKETYTDEELKLLQDQMALIESYYHGTSSGLDCLISLIDKPVFIESRKKVQAITAPALADFGHFYLLDSGLERKTSPLVHKFLEMIEQSNELNESFEIFKNQNNQLIDSFLQFEPESFKSSFKDLSHHQANLFKDFIPANVEEFWQAGLKGQDYFTKFCGAGGGGFFLVYSNQALNMDKLISL